MFSDVAHELAYTDALEENERQTGHADDGVSASIALPTPVASGRHPAVVIIDDGVGARIPLCR